MSSNNDDDVLFLKCQYAKCFPDGDKLSKISSLINWERFKPILEPLFKNNGEGRPHEDVVLMMKVLVLQSWYGISDERIERECKDRLTFQNFLGYPKKVPDARTVWVFRERIAKQPEKEKEMWRELQRQLKKYRVKPGKVEDVAFIEKGGWRAEGVQGPIVPISPHTGYAQDSTIIDADPGVPTEEDVKRREEAKKKREERKRRKQIMLEQQQTVPQQKNDDDKTTAATVDLSQQQFVSAPTTPAKKIETKPRGMEAFTRRSKDGTWTKKNERSFFGYKLHTKSDLSTGYVSDFDVTTASLHDENMDLTKKGEPCVRDRGYTNGGGRGLCITMIRASPGKPLTEKQKELNSFLSKVRAPVEHPYAVMKRIFHGGRVLVTTVQRVKVKMTFVCTCYNLFRAHTLSQLV